MALFLVQKQIQHNKESFIYDQSLFMKVLDHHLFECHSIEIDKQTIRFNYPQKKFQIDFTEQGTILNTTDTLQIEARIIDFKVDERSNIVEHFNMEMHIRNQALTLLKKPAYSNAKKINSQFIDFSF